MNKFGLFLMSIGILLFIITGADVISIVVFLMEKILSADLNSQFFSSFIFRGGLIIIGGILLLIGGILYKENSDDIL